jgi:transcriptional regulator with XRE-family HTH domain
MTQDRGTQSRAEVLGAYLKSLRTGAQLSLREVEEATNKEVSNAYLSQLENGKIAKPSPNILHSLAAVYHVPYEKLMEYAGYLSPSVNRPEGVKHGSAATYSIDNLTKEEEKELLDYLTYFVRRKREKS